MVYINFNPDHLSQSSELELHLPHWGIKNGFKVVAPHKVDRNGQYKFVVLANEESSHKVYNNGQCNSVLPDIEESPQCHASIAIIPISGHTSLFAMALEKDCQKSYLLLPFYNELRTQLRVFVTYFCSVWPEVSISILNYIITCLFYIMSFHFTVNMPRSPCIFLKGCSEVIFTITCRFLRQRF